MEPFLFALIPISVILLAIVIRLIAGAIDGDRITEYIQERGGQIVEKHWNPFGKGWVGEQNARIYEVTYEDADGNLHKATCKTSMLAGVYFTEDIIVQRRQRPSNSSDTDSLQEENRRLREEIERLRSSNE